MRSCWVLNCPSISSCARRCPHAVRNFSSSQRNNYSSQTDHTPEEASDSADRHIDELPKFSKLSQRSSDAHEQPGAEETTDDSKTTSHAVDENQQRSATNDDTNDADLLREIKKLRTMLEKTKHVEDKLATLEVRLSASESREKSMGDRLDAITQERDEMERQHRVLWNNCFFFKACLTDLTDKETKALDVLYRAHSLLKEQVGKLATEQEAFNKENKGLGDKLQTMVEFATKSKNAAVVGRIANESAMAHIKNLEEKVEELETESRKQETLAKQEAFEKRRSAMN